MTADIHRVGLTGARFGRAPRRPQADPTAPVDAVPAGGSPVPPQRESRKGPIPPLPQPQRAPVPPLPRPQRPPVPPPRNPLGGSPLHLFPEPEIDDPDLDLDAVSAPTVRVRPYIHTGGRTRPSTPLPLESMVCTAPGASALRLNGAHRWVAELCSVPQSVAEVSARLGVPLAVARVVVDDLVEQRMVTVQRGVGNKAPDVSLMKRVLAGLQRL